MIESNNLSVMNSGSKFVNLMVKNLNKRVWVRIRIAIQVRWNIQFTSEHLNQGQNDESNSRHFLLHHDPLKLWAEVHILGHRQPSLQAREPEAHHQVRVRQPRQCHLPVRMERTRVPERRNSPQPMFGADLQLLWQRMCSW